MARAPNFYYQDPTAAIGNSMVTAIFGDPALRAQQQERQAQLEERLFYFLLSLCKDAPPTGAASGAHAKFAGILQG